MFTPEMMEAAQKMMANMTPEQMSQMAAMASKMNPDMLKQMNRGNAGMPMPSASQFEEVSERMKNMTPEEMSNMFGEAKNKMTGKNAYMVNGATVLKNEGNDKVRGGDYSGAIETFKSALSNLESCPAPDDSVHTLIQSIKLNMALCSLKLEDYETVISTCDSILARDPKSVKALFRRGVAKRENSDILDGAKDLKLAMLLSSQDEIIKGEYEKTIEQIYDPAELEQLDSVDIGSPTTASAGRPNLAKAKEIIESNPEVIDRMGDMLSNMDEDQLNGILEMSAAGMGGEQRPDLGEMKKILKNKEFMKSMTEMMKNMDMSQMSGLLGGHSVAATSSTGDVATAASPSSPSVDAGMPDMSNILKDPTAVKQLGKMLDAMPDSVLEDMVKSQTGGSSAPSFLTGKRMKMIAKVFIALLSVWIYIRQFFRILMSTRGKVIIAAILVLVGLYMQFGSLVFRKEDERKIRDEEL